MSRRYLAAILGSVLSLFGCATALAGRNFDIHLTNLGQVAVTDLVINFDVFMFPQRELRPGARSGLLLNSRPWPKQISVTWTNASTGQKHEETVPVPPPPPSTSKDWYIAVLFFDDEIMVKSLAQVTRWDPVLKGAPFYYGEDVEEKRRQVKK